MLPRILRRVETLYWERHIGISTRGYYQPPWAGPEHKFYSTVSYRAVFKILSFLSLNERDVFVDLGCGKGRITCCAARSPVAAVIGVEDVEGLSVQAKRNAEHMRGRRATIRIIDGKAEAFDCTPGTVFFLYNPFGPGTLRSVLTNIYKSLATKPSPVKVAYVNPVHDSLLADLRWFRCVARWQTCVRAGCEHPVSFWETTGE